MKMETLHASFLSESSSAPFWVLKPIYLHGFSGSLHLILLIGLIASFVFKNYRVGDREGSDHNFDRKNTTLCYNQIVLCCSVVSLFNFVFLLLSYFIWFKHAWSDDNLVMLFDSMLRTVSWAVLAVFLSVEGKITFLLRVWWGLYLTISSYSLVVDNFVQANYKVSAIQFLASDIVSVSTGLFLCIMGYSKHTSKENTPLEKPLLNGDRCSKGSDTLTPYSSAGFFSTLTFSWMGSIIATGYKKTLDLGDVPQLYGKDTAAVAFPTFRNYLGLETGTVTTFKLVKALICSFWKDILLTGLFSLINTSATYVGPYLIDSFIQCLSGRGQFKNQGYLLVLIFFTAKLVECLSLRHWLFRLQQAGVQVKVVLVASIYNKGLALSSLSRQGHSSGEIINHMAVDAERIGTCGWYIHDPWLVIFQVGFALLILYKNLGLASLAAFAATVLIMLLNYPLGRLQETFQEKLMEWKDKRMKTTSEILRNMRILKLQGWEMKFLSRIFDIRKMEEKWLRTYLYASAMTNFIHWVAPTFVSVVTFGACYIIGFPLESGKILSALATFRILQIPIYNLPDTISMLVQTKVSLDRIASFLCLEELQSDVIEKIPRCNSDTAIEIVNGSFSWDLTSSNPTLRDINLKVYHGIRVAVSGTVGSGKSSLLSCILGEMCNISGSVRLSGTKAYVSQSPWIQSGTVEENILFGKEMNREWYERILEACSLKKDLEILSFGDQTVIGERGINLSGGQKQRIQIARALYQDSDIYLLDDPFSAVDAHTGSHIFKEVILNLLSTKTVIYITHQVEFLPAADLILVMKDGMITQAGKYDEILTPGSDFMELVQAHKEALLPLDPKQKETLCENGIIREDNAGKKQENNVTQNGKSNEEVVPKRQLIQEEEREKGQVGFSVYWKYITAAYGGAFVPFILLAEILNQILSISSNYWMASATPESKDIKPVTSESTLILVYVAFSIGTSVCLFVRVTLLVTVGYKTATLLFNKMHHCIFRAPMSFFDATPSGRILNRASTDQNQVDLQMAYQVGAVAFIMSEVLGILGVMSQVAWQILIILIPVTLICIWYQKYYIPTARELSRLVGVCKAPILQHFAETVSGLTTIRSFDQETRFQETNLKLTDEYSRPRFHVIGAMEWLCFRLDMFSCITFAVLLITIISFRDRIDLAIAGLAVTYGLNLNTLQTRVVWKICNLENKIISVERILQYLSIPSEPPLVIKEHRPDKSWPSLGEVAIDNLKVQYAPHMPLVLHGISCIFPGGNKTGIVGRTGSGKSTLIQALFRIVEPSSGCILVDGVNILTLGLHDLRSRLSIIPQDPTMFEGTVRSNLDPLEEYTDAQIWEALDKCQLGDEVRKKEKKLDSAVSENGENWSMGQRQLVCLGRVLLKRSKVLVLDEATASVDTATDNLIQQTIRQQFFDSTVIIIAHRITSVVDSDMVLFLSHGMVEEYGTPAKLLENKSSEFARLVAEYTRRSSSSFEM